MMLRNKNGRFKQKPQHRGERYWGKKIGYAA